MKRILFRLALLSLSFIIALSSTFLIAKRDSAMADEGEILNNFLSRSRVEYENVNDKTVSVDIFYREVDEAMNNPNVAQAIMIKQATDYKIKHPEKRVDVTLTSFHMSVVASVCIDRESEEFGKMKSLYDVEYDSKGYYRIVYLLVEAAKHGVNVIAIGHIDGGAVMQEGGMTPDHNFTQYFEGHLNDSCYNGENVVGDFMTAKTAYWTSYGDKDAYDMMHLKTCTVSNYIDWNGVEHGSAVWTGSINLDGVDMNGSNGNNAIQTGIVISEHEELRRVTYNYTKLIVENCNQEHVNYFRNLVKNKNAKQIALIEQGRENEIDREEQIVYLGGEKDQIFELYFTPLGGNVENWDKQNNPYCKYLSKLLPSVSGEDYIEFFWNNVKFVSNYPLAQTFEDVLQYSFLQNSRLENKMFLRLYGINTGKFEVFKQGENIGFFSLNEYMGISHHVKDFQLSYKENGERQYVSVINSLNFHSGAMFGQSNSIFVIKETLKTGNDFYCNFGNLLVPGVDFEQVRIK